MSQIQVVLAEKSVPVRLGLKTILAHQKDLTLAGEAADSPALFNLLQALSPPAEVCLLSLSLPPAGCYSTLVRLQEEHPTIGVIILAPHLYSPAVWCTLLRGAVAFILENETERELLPAIRTVAEDCFYHNKIVTTTMVRNFADKHVVKAALTTEELLFLSQCCCSETYDSIAGDLQFGTSKVQHLRKSIFEKLAVTCRTGLANAAVQLGIHPNNR